MVRDDRDGLAMRSERGVRALIEHGGNPMALIDARGRYTHVNAGAADLLGHRPAALLKRSAFDSIHAADVERAKGLFASVLAHPGATVEAHLRLRRPDGAPRWVEAVVTNLLDEPEVAAIVATFHDVSARKTAEQEVLAINRRLRAALAEVSEREETIERQAERLRLLNEFARTVSSALDLSSVSALVVEETARVLACAACAIHRYDPQADRLRFVARWTRQRGTELGTPGEWTPEQHAVGRAIRTGAPHAVQDAAGSELAPDQAAAQLGMRSLAVVPILVDGAVWGTLGVGFAEQGGASPDRMEFLESIGAHLSVAIKNAQLYTDLRWAHAELQHRQEQVIQQERLRALGEMASGVAHDLNNALAPVVGFSELLLTQGEALQDTERASHLLRLIHTGAQDAASVVGRLREFYRPRSTDEVFAQVNVHRLVERAVSLTQPKWKDQAQAQGRTIAMDVQLAPVPAITGDEAALREVLTNLIFNAADAMPAGGGITINAQAAASAVRLEVRDTGVGMTDEVRRRCFEPFFTTKGEHGTGLGLAQVYGIVGRHRGQVEVHSAPGRGTAVVLLLPLDPGEAPAAGAPPAPHGASIEGRSLRVLVVDDEQSVQRVTVAFLTAVGHRAVEASSGQEALAQLHAGQGAGQPFDLVMTDSAMPGMSGTQLAAEIKRVAPHLPVVLVTGFGDLMAAAGERPPGVDRVVGKPLTLEKLRAALEAVVTPTE